MFQEPGKVKCQDRPEKFKDCQVVFGPGGELICENEQPQPYFDMCDSKGNMIRFPENFKRDTKPCPNGFSCQNRSRKLQNSRAQYVTDLICEENQDKLCLPDNGKLPSLTNLLKSFEMPKTVCSSNPCPQLTTPKIDEDGYYR